MDNGWREKACEYGVILQGISLVYERIDSIVKMGVYVYQECAYIKRLSERIWWGEWGVV